MSVVVTFSYTCIVNKFRPDIRSVLKQSDLSANQKVNRHSTVRSTDLSQSDININVIC